MWWEDDRLIHRDPGKSRAAVAAKCRSRAYCNGAGCEWCGPALDAKMCGDVGPLCPECGETCEITMEVV